MMNTNNNLAMPSFLDPIIHDYGVFNITGREIQCFLQRHQDGTVKTSQVRHMKELINHWFDYIYEQLKVQAKNRFIYQKKDLQQLAQAFCIKLSRNKSRGILKSLTHPPLTLNRIYLSKEHTQLFNTIAMEMNMNCNAFLMYLLHVFLYGINNEILPLDDIFFKNTLLFNNSTQELYQEVKPLLVDHFGNTIKASK